MSRRTAANKKRQRSTIFSPLFGKKLSGRIFTQEPANEVRDVSHSQLGHNFGDVQVESPTIKESYPLAHTGQAHCPFGGVYRTCSFHVQESLNQPTLRSRYGPVQTKSTGAMGLSSVHSDAERGVRGSPRPLPHLEHIQSMFGSHDVMGVQAHVGGAASDACEAIGAEAYTTGNAVAFKSSPNLRMVAHEAAHVVQQRGGVQLKDGIGRAEDAYERHADAVAEFVVQGKSAEGLLTHVPSSGGSLSYLQRQNVESTVSGDNSSGRSLSQDSAVDSQNILPDEVQLLQPLECNIQTSSTYALQMKGGPKRRKRKVISVPRRFKVTRELSTTEFRTMVMTELFGGVIPHVNWTNEKPLYTPDKNPHIVNVDVNLIRRYRGQVNVGRGLDVDIEGGIKGAKGRARMFHSRAKTKEKSALLDEIDSRYYKAAGVAPGTLIKEGEKGRAALWRMIRDEVLLQHEYITNLPPQVKKLIKFSIKGKELTPADYDKLFAIAKKIENMPPGQVSDYASKVTGATTDLDTLEASLDKYIAEMTERGRKGEEHEKIHTKLIGLEEVYKKYKLYKSLLTSSSIMSATSSGYSGGGVGTGIGTLLVAEKVRKELETQLQAHDFAGITEFETFIKKYEQAFEQEAAHIAKDLLKKYAGKLYRESERYNDPKEVAALHQKLGGVRTQYGEFETNAKIWNDYVKARKKSREQSRIPGQGHLRTRNFTSTTPSEAEAARKKAEVAKAAAQAQVKGTSSEHPIFQEEGLKLDKRINKEALAKASKSELGVLLQGHIQNRMKDIAKARAEIEGKPELIYKMVKLMPQFYVHQGIRPGSIHDKIIQDKMKSDAILKLGKGIALAIVAIALAVVTFGKAIPAILSVGAGIVGAGLGGYMAYEEYLEYAQQKDLADVGFANDPSVAWLVIAVAGAALDMASAIKAVSALGKAAKALNAGGELKTFTNVVRQLEREKKLTVEIAHAAEKAAAARKGLEEASSELTTALGKAYTVPGPLADLDVYKAVVNMARQAIKTKVYDAQKFIDELKLARVKAGLGDFTPEKLAKAKQAWEEAKKLVKNEAASIAKYGDSMSKLLARTDLPGDLQNDIILQVGRAMKNASVDDNAVRTAISAMRRAENPRNVREFLAELRHVNEVASAKSLAKGSKVYSGVKKSMPDGSLRLFDMGNGIKVDISPVSEADALYRAGGKIHLDEVKHTASALSNKLRDKPQQLQNLVDWRAAGQDRTVSIVIENEVKWTNLLGKPDVFKLLIKHKMPIKIGAKVFDPAKLSAFYAKIEAKYIEQVVKGGMSPRAFFELPEMATLDSAAKFVGYP